MTLLRDLSLVWSLVHVLILFAFFYESRFPRAKTLLLTAVCMTPIGVLNIIGVVLCGPELMGQLLILTCTIPSGIFFFLMAKNRNAKFLFTFCVVDTLSYEIVILSRLIDFYLCGDRHIAMLIIRLIAFPLMEWIAFRYLRKPYLEVKNAVKSGWGIFTLVTAIYYLLLLATVNFPTFIISRTEDLPAVLLVLILMPITYIGIFITLRNQMHLAEAKSREEILLTQAAALEQRIEEIGELEDQIKIQRHDIRHRYSVISEMLRAGKTNEALLYINQTQEVLSSIKETTYCTHAAINAVFAYYIRKAEANGIKTDVHISIPSDFEFNATEFSVVAANALENAINANLLLPQEKRFIKCQSVSRPQFVFRISNPFTGKITFGPDGLPTSDKSGHGTGIRSLTAFCEKYEVYFEFKTENGLFVFSMMK